MQNFKKVFRVIAFFAFVLRTVVVLGQGSEDFTNLPTTSSGSYLSRSWTGTDGVTWTATLARTDQTITGKAICFGSSGSRAVTSPTYTGGIGTLSFDYVRGFTGTGARSIEVWVNGSQIGSSITVSNTSDVVATYSQALNISGSIQIEVRSTGSAQVKLDNISWTAGTPLPPSNCSGQMSGTYTINPAAAASCTNYQDFASAISDMIAGSRSDDNDYRHDGGISGAVVFEVANGTYTEVVTITVAIPGASSSNTVTFRSASGDPVDVLLQTPNTATTAEVLLDGTEYVAFEDMSIENTGTASSRFAVDIDGTSSNITFDNCILSRGVATSSTTAYAVVIADPGSVLQTNNRILNCQIQNGGYGIYFDNDNTSSRWTGIEISGNTFSGQYGRPLDIEVTGAVVVSGNTFICSSTFAAFMAMYLNDCDGDNQITGNYVYTTGSGRVQYGLYLNGSTAAGSGLIANNSIQVENANSNCFGVYLPSTSTGYDILNNTLYVSGGSTTSTSVYPLQSYTSSDAANVRNNVFVNGSSGTGTNYCVYLANTSGYATISDNEYYTSNTGSPFRGYYGGAYSDFALFSAAAESGTPLNIDPLLTFVSGVGWKVTHPSLTGAAPLLSGIGADIDGNVRLDPTTMGAHENNLGVFPPLAEFSASSTSTCPATTVTFTDASLNTPTSWAWSFSPSTVTYVGGTSASSQNPQVQFNASGLYEVTLTATNADGSDDEVKTDYIAVGLSGTFTIGGTTPDYATFTDAVTDLNALGVCGPVVFNARNGTYTEQISLGQIVGTSATNTVTFQSESGVNTDVVLTWASSTGIANNYTVQLDGSDHVTFQNLTVQRTGTSTYAKVFDFAGDASYNTIQGNIVVGRTGSASSLTNNSVIACNDGGNTGNINNTISNNQITGGNAGVYWEGGSSTYPADLTISGNTFACYQYGIYLKYVNEAEIQSNTITDGASTSAGTIGIYAFHVDGVFNIQGNAIILKANANTTGLDLNACTGGYSAIGVISNNMVSVGSNSSESSSGAGDGTGYSEGVYMNGTSYKNIFYNSFLSTSTNPTTGRGFYINGYSDANVHLRNNIFAQNGGGFAFYNSVTSAIVSSDYNDFYAPGGLFAHWGADVADLAALQSASGMDANSVSNNPGFVSNTDLHVVAGSGIDGLAAVLSITNDIDGDARDGSTPDIGADEYDNTLPIVTLDADVNTGTEAAGTVITLTATASFAVTGDQTVDLAITGTGITGTDYTLSGVTITILDGQTTGSVTFTVLNDTDAEGPEVATATISNPTSGIVISISGDSEDLIIVDDDICEIEDMDGGSIGSSSYGTSTYVKNSGAIVYGWVNGIRETSTANTHNGSTYAIRLQDATGSEFTATITDGGISTFSAYVRRWDSSPDPDYTVEYSTDNGSSWNYVTTLNNVWFNNTDDYKELTFAVNAASVSGNSADDIIVRIIRNGGERIIIDDITWGCYATNPVVSLGISPSSGTEDDETTITLTATADSPVSGDQTVDVYISAGGTASDFYNGADFTGTVTITILDGQTTGTITFDVFDDSDIEGDETVTFSLTNPSSGLNLDIPANISVDFDITDNDNLTSYESVIIEQGGEIAAISSLVNGSISSVADGVQVWTFRLYDGDGTTNDADALPTIYSGWTIRQSAGNQVPDWDAAINDLAFFIGSTELSSGGILINGSTITFSFINPANYISVPDGGYVEIDMRLTLEPSLPTGSDGQHFGFSIDDSDVQVDSDLLASSQLGTFTETSDAAQNEIEVVATVLSIDAPAGVTLGSNFSLTVSAVDANGNVDTDVTNSVTLSLTSGAGVLTGAPTTANLVDGTYTYTGLNHDTEEVIEVTAHDNGSVYLDVTASIIVSVLPHQFFDDFNRSDNAVVGIPSSETVLTYAEIGTGDGTRTRVEGNELVLANCNDGESTGGNNGMERVMFDVAHRFETTYDNAATDLEWVFNINQSRPSPSGLGTGTTNTYAVAVILGSTHEDIYDASAAGYAVIIGHPGSTPDYVKLIRFASGMELDANTTDIALSTESDADSHFSVKVTYSPCSGLWSIWVRDDGSSFADPTVGSLGTPVTGTDITHVTSDLKYFGYIWKHGTSCTETATFDNVSIPNSVTGTPTSGNKVWNGSVNTDWHVAGNWGPCQDIPTMTDDVLIPNTANKPHIFPGMIGLCNTIKVETDNGAKLTIENTGKLKVHQP